MMEWPRLLSAKRLGVTYREEPNSARSPFQQDFDRIIFSTAFRRLQDKTQVFPLADNDFVRTRLTHSLEASSVGRSLGTMVGEKVCQRHGLAPQFHPSDFGAIVAAACVAHDIGNPPFGHSGEDAIRHWFDHSRSIRKCRRWLDPAERTDFAKYEGNAQGFRLLARLQMAAQHGGFQLTYATLGTFAKYPSPSSAIGTGPWSRKKFGYFQEDVPLFDEVARHLGLLPQGGGWTRHPLAFLVEAADDICYRMVDFEDGFRLDCVRYEEVHRLFVEVIGKVPSRLAEMGDDKSKVEYLRARAIGAAVAQVGEEFCRLEKEILGGTLAEPLIDLIPASRALTEIENISLGRIYGADEVIEIEAAGFEVLGGLLDVFSAAALALKPDKHEEKMLQLVPSQFLPKDATPYARLLAILDFVSGMTDSYAVSLYKKIKGISLPGR